MIIIVLVFKIFTCNSSMVTKKSTKKSSAITPLTSNWFDIDKSIDNLRKEMEKAFSSFPAISMPKLSHTSCDVIDEGKQFRVVFPIFAFLKKLFLICFFLIISHYFSHAISAVY